MERYLAPILGVLLWILTASPTNGLVCTKVEETYEYEEATCNQILEYFLNNWEVYETPSDPGDLDEFHTCKFKRQTGHIDIPYCCDGYSGTVETGCQAICKPECIQNGGHCDIPHVCNCTGSGRQGKNCRDPGEGLPTSVIEQIHDLPFRTCINSGVQYYRQFDGLEFVFGGTCKYILVKTEDVTVMVEHVGCEEYGQCRKRLIIEVDGYVISLFDSKAYLDGNEVQCTPEGNSITNRASIIYLDIMDLDIDPGVRVKFDGHKNIMVTVDKDIQTPVSGICGNNNGNHGDDIVGPDGEAYKSLVKFGNSWHVANEEGKECSSSGSVPDFCDTPELKEEAKQICSKMHASVFSDCLSDMQSTTLFEICQNEICKTTDESVRREIVCDSLDGLGRRCGCLGYDVAWRSEDLCPRQCPPGFVYQSNISPCPKTCSYIHSDLPDVCLQQPKVSMCACPEGQYLHKGECIDAVECPCKMNGKEYHHGDKTLLQCNLCECKLGQWLCERNRCPATCSIVGLHHITTWDGKTYNLRPPLKSCSYNVIQTVPGMESETRNLDVRVYTSSLNKITTRLVQVEMKFDSYYIRIETSNGADPILRVNDVETPLPYEEEEVFVKRATTQFVVVKAFGIFFYTDLDSRLYFRIDPYFSEKIIGLCGRYDYQSDNDMSIDIGGILMPVPPLDFIQDYTSTDCKLSTTLSRCEFQSQAMRSSAESMCGHLRDESFLGECHSLVNWQKYFEDCINDMCLSNGLNDFKSMCTMTSALDNKCTEYDIQVNWNNVPFVKQFCAKKCSGGMMYTENARIGGTSCSDLWYENTDLYEDIRVPGCVCPNSLYLLNGICVRKSDCPCKNVYEPESDPYPAGATWKRECQSCICQNGVFECSEPDEGCIDEVICAHESQVYMFKDFQPQRRCGSKEVTVPKTPGCGCVDGLVISSTGGCIQESECPCYYGGQPHQNGSIITHRCFTMTCTNGNWDMQASSKCPGICSATGEKNYHTFDGEIFQLGGSCTFTLLQFSDVTIDISNVVCSFGTVCSKKIEIKFNGLVIQMSRGAPLKIGDLSFPENQFTSLDGSVVVSSSGNFFTIVHMKHYGLQVQYDGAMRVYLYLDPNYMGETRGLCGNYDQMMIGDFVLKDGSSTFDPLQFGREWASTSTCNIETSVECTDTNEQYRWSVESCELIKDTTGVFASCIDSLGGADESIIREFYKQCINQACSCENGGSCECLCTAIASFADVCSVNGYPTMWRSQKLCPIQCEHGQVYKACGTVCENSCKAKTASTGSDCVGCVEGCFCKEGMYRNDDSTCVPIEECPCYKGNIAYQSGSLYTTTCGSCICENGEFVCEENCPVCTDGEYMCGGHCIELEHRCDGIVDCDDGSDELNCPEEECALGEFMCISGQCISETLRCNGVYDCGSMDFSDEINCEEEMPECHEDDFRCGNETGPAALCIPMEWVCDKYPDCPDFSDENFDGCEDECTTTPEMFRCENLNCNHLLKVCDGFDDCGDGSDEYGCDGCFCDSNMFTCNYDDNCECLDPQVLCDGVIQCGDGSDEQNCMQPETTTTSPITTTSITVPIGVCSDADMTVGDIPIGDGNNGLPYVSLTVNGIDTINKSTDIELLGETELDLTFVPDMEVMRLSIVTDVTVIVRQVITDDGVTIDVNQEYFPVSDLSRQIDIPITSVTTQRVSAISLSVLPLTPISPIHIMLINIEGCIHPKEVTTVTTPQPTFSTRAPCLYGGNEVILTPEDVVLTDSDNADITSVLSGQSYVATSPSVEIITLSANDPLKPISIVEVNTRYVSQLLVKPEEFTSELTSEDTDGYQLFTITANAEYTGGSIELGLYPSDLENAIEIINVIVKSCVPIPTTTTTGCNYMNLDADNMNDYLDIAMQNAEGEEQNLNYLLEDQPLVVDEPGSEIVFRFSDNVEQILRLQFRTTGVQQITYTTSPQGITRFKNNIIPSGDTVDIYFEDTVNNVSIAITRSTPAATPVIENLVVEICSSIPECMVEMINGTQNQDLVDIFYEGSQVQQMFSEEGLQLDTGKYSYEFQITINENGMIGRPSKLNGVSITVMTDEATVEVNLYLLSEVGETLSSLVLERDSDFPNIFEYKRSPKKLSSSTLFFVVSARNPFDVNLSNAEFEICFEEGTTTTMITSTTQRCNVQMVDGIQNQDFIDVFYDGTSIKDVLSSEGVELTDSKQSYEFQIYLHGDVSDESPLELLRFGIDIDTDISDITVQLYPVTEGGDTVDPLPLTRDVITSNQFIWNDGPKSLFSPNLILVISGVTPFDVRLSDAFIEICFEGEQTSTTSSISTTTTISSQTSCVMTDGMEDPAYIPRNKIEVNVDGQETDEFVSDENVFTFQYIVDNVTLNIPLNEMVLISSVYMSNNENVADNSVVIINGNAVLLPAYQIAEMLDEISVVIIPNEPNDAVIIQLHIMGCFSVTGTTPSSLTTTQQCDIKMIDGEQNQDLIDVIYDGNSVKDVLTAEGVVLTEAKQSYEFQIDFHGEVSDEYPLELFDFGINVEAGIPDITVKLYPVSDGGDTIEPLVLQSDLVLSYYYKYEGLPVTLFSPTFILVISSSSPFDIGVSNVGVVVCLETEMSTSTAYISTTTTPFSSVTSCYMSDGMEDQSSIPRSSIQINVDGEERDVVFSEGNVMLFEAVQTNITVYIQLNGYVELSSIFLTDSENVASSSVLINDANTLEIPAFNIRDMVNEIKILIVPIIQNEDVQVVLHVMGCFNAGSTSTLAATTTESCYVQMVNGAENQDSIDIFYDGSSVKEILSSNGLEIENEVSIYNFDIVFMNVNVADNPIELHSFGVIVETDDSDVEVKLFPFMEGGNPDDPIVLEREGILFDEYTWEGPPRLLFTPSMLLVISSNAPFKVKISSLFIEACFEQGQVAATSTTSTTIAPSSATVCSMIDGMEGSSFVSLNDIEFYVDEIERTVSYSVDNIMIMEDVQQSVKINIPLRNEVMLTSVYLSLSENVGSNSVVMINNKPINLPVFNIMETVNVLELMLYPDNARQDIILRFHIIGCEDYEETTISSTTTTEICDIRMVNGYENEDMIDILYDGTYVKQILNSDGFTVDQLKPRYEFQIMLTEYVSVESPLILSSFTINIDASVTTVNVGLWPVTSGGDTADSIILYRVSENSDVYQWTGPPQILNTRVLMLVIYAEVPFEMTLSNLAMEACFDEVQMIESSTTTSTTASSMETTCVMSDGMTDYSFISYDEIQVIVDGNTANVDLGRGDTTVYKDVQNMIKITITLQTPVYLSSVYFSSDDNVSDGSVVTVDGMEMDLPAFSINEMVTVIEVVVLPREINQDIELKLHVIGCFENIPMTSSTTEGCSMQMIGGMENQDSIDIFYNGNSVKQVLSMDGFQSDEISSTFVFELVFADSVIVDTLELLQFSINVNTGSEDVNILLYPVAESGDKAEIPLILSRNSLSSDIYSWNGPTRTLFSRNMLLMISADSPFEIGISNLEMQACFEEELIQTEVTSTTQSAFSPESTECNMINGMEDNMYIPRRSLQILIDNQPGDFNILPGNIYTFENVQNNISISIPLTPSVFISDVYLSISENVAEGSIIIVDETPMLLPAININELVNNINLFIIPSNPDQVVQVQFSVIGCFMLQSTTTTLSTTTTAECSIQMIDGSENQDLIDVYYNGNSVKQVLGLNGFQTEETLSTYIFELVFADIVIVETLEILEFSVNLDTGNRNVNVLLYPLAEGGDKAENPLILSRDTLSSNVYSWNGPTRTLFSRTMMIMISSDSPFNIEISNVVIQACFEKETIQTEVTTTGPSTYTTSGTTCDMVDGMEDDSFIPRNTLQITVDNVHEEFDILPGNIYPFENVQNNISITIPFTPSVFISDVYFTTSENVADSSVVLVNEIPMLLPALNINEMGNSLTIIIFPNNPNEDVQIKFSVIGCFMLQSTTTVLPTTTTSECTAKMINGASNQDAIGIYYDGTSVKQVLNEAEYESDDARSSFIFQIDFVDDVSLDLPLELFGFSITVLSDSPSINVVLFPITEGGDTSDSIVLTRASLDSNQYVYGGSPRILVSRTLILSISSDVPARLQLSNLEMMACFETEEQVTEVTTSTPSTTSSVGTPCYMIDGMSDDMLIPRNKVQVFVDGERTALDMTDGIIVFRKVQANVRIIISLDTPVLIRNVFFSIFENVGTDSVITVNSNMISLPAFNINEMVYLMEIDVIPVESNEDIEVTMHVIGCFTAQSTTSTMTTPTECAIKMISGTENQDVANIFYGDSSVKEVLNVDGLELDENVSKYEFNIELNTVISDESPIELYSFSINVDTSITDVSVKLFTVTEGGDLDIPLVPIRATPGSNQFIWNGPSRILYTTALILEIESDSAFNAKLSNMEIQACFEEGVSTTELSSTTPSTFSSVGTTCVMSNGMENEAFIRKSTIQVLVDNVPQNIDMTTEDIVLFRNVQSSVTVTIPLAESVFIDSVYLSVSTNVADISQLTINDNIMSLPAFNINEMAESLDIMIVPIEANNDIQIKLNIIGCFMEQSTTMQTTTAEECSIIMVDGSQNENLIDIFHNGNPVKEVLGSGSFTADTTNIKHKFYIEFSSEVSSDDPVELYEFMVSMETSIPVDNVKLYTITEGGDEDVVMILYKLSTSSDEYAWSGPPQVLFTRSLVLEITADVPFEITLSNLELKACFVIEEKVTEVTSTLPSTYSISSTTCMTIDGMTDSLIPKNKIEAVVDDKQAEFDMNEESLMTFNNVKTNVRISIPLGMPVFITSVYLSSIDNIADGSTVIINNVTITLPAFNIELYTDDLELIIVPLELNEDVQVKISIIGCFMEQTTTIQTSTLGTTTYQECEIRMINGSQNQNSIDILYDDSSVKQILGSEGFVPNVIDTVYVFTLEFLDEISVYYPINLIGFSVNVMTDEPSVNVTIAELTEGGDSDQPMVLERLSPDSNEFIWSGTPRVILTRTVVVVVSADSPFTVNISNIAVEACFEEEIKTKEMSTTSSSGFTSSATVCAMEDGMSDNAYIPNENIQVLMNDDQGTFDVSEDNVYTFNNVESSISITISLEVPVYVTSVYLSNIQNIDESSSVIVGNNTLQFPAFNINEEFDEITLLLIPVEPNDLITFKMHVIGCFSILSTTSETSTSSFPTSLGSTSTTITSTIGCTMDMINSTYNERLFDIFYNGNTVKDILGEAGFEPNGRRPRFELEVVLSPTITSISPVEIYGFSINIETDKDTVNVNLYSTTDIGETNGPFVLERVDPDSDEFIFTGASLTLYSGSFILEVSADSPFGVKISDVAIEACFEEEQVCQFTREEFRLQFGKEALLPEIGYIDTDDDGFDLDDVIVELDDIIHEGVIVSILCHYCQCAEGEMKCEVAENCTECEYTEWSDWSTCTKTCGGGITSRNRNIITPGSDCDYNTDETESCNNEDCEAPTWNTWSPWSECLSTEPCIQGENTRTRTCSIPEQCGDDNMETAPCNIDDDCTPEDCSDPNMVYDSCGNKYCTDNYLSCYDSFFDIYCEDVEDDCIPSCICKHGYILNDQGVCVDTCTNCYSELGIPIPESLEDPTMALPCQYCKCEQMTNGAYDMVCYNETNCCESDEWSEWGECVSTCGPGTRYRTRNVYGIGCDLPNEDFEPCNNEECPPSCKDGEYGYYLGDIVPSDDECYICTCEVPDSIVSGISCHQNLSSIVDGGWGSWSPWSGCTSRSGCGEGAMQRVRSCDRPFPSCGGDECQGDTIETQPCQLPSCCETTPWSDYDNCSMPCGTGNQTRTRNFTDPASSECDSVLLEETIPCNTDPCDDECEISDWSDFNACSETCGNGTQSRTRTIHDGECEGFPLTEEQNCNLQPCQEECTENQVPDRRTVCQTETCFDYILMLNNLTVPECVDDGMAMFNCYCDEGFYLDSDGNCVTPQECTMCRMENGTLIQEGTEFVLPEECTRYICSQGQLIEESVCRDDYVCDAGETLVMLEGECCPQCLPYTEVPDPCQLHTSSEYLRLGDCISLQPVTVTYCLGSCGNSNTMPVLYAGGETLQSRSECTCCKGKTGNIIDVDVRCGDLIKVAHYQNMKSCGCKQCLDENSPDTEPPR